MNVLEFVKMTFQNHFDRSLVFLSHNKDNLQTELAHGVDIVNMIETERCNLKQLSNNFEQSFK